MSSIYQIDLKAQQLVLDALGGRVQTKKSVVLCQDASQLTSTDGLLVATHDRLEEFLAHKQFEIFSVLPNVSLIKKLCKTSSIEELSIELVFICNSTSDPVEVIVDLIGKFATENVFVKEVSYLTSLPAGTFRKGFASDAYTVKITTIKDDSFQLIWKNDMQFFKEALIPKAILQDEDVARVLNDRKGHFNCKTYKRNCCREVGGSGNCTPIVFKPSGRDSRNHDAAVERLIELCRDKAYEYPASVIQYRSHDALKSDGVDHFSIVFLRHLDSTQLDDFAQHLTACRIDFFVPAPKVFVISLVGVDCAVLIRLFHYAEIPIPTTTKQGAFGISIVKEQSALLRNWNNDCGSYRVTVGRISSLSSIPVQIKLNELYGVLSEDFCYDEVLGHLGKELQAFGFQQVYCLDTEGQVDQYLQCHVPKKSEDIFPCNVQVNGISLFIEHALPFLSPTRQRRRPPVEESMHDHWKRAVTLAPRAKKDRINHIAPSEKNFASLQRVGNLIEFPLRSKRENFICSFENSDFPVLFVDGLAGVHDCLDAFVKLTLKNSDWNQIIEEAVDNFKTDQDKASDVPTNTAMLYGFKVTCHEHKPLKVACVMNRNGTPAVSCTEMVMCYAYTECLLFAVLPQGIRPESFCLPKKNFEVVARIPLGKKQEFQENTEENCFPTPLGCNNTQKSEYLVATPVVVEKVVGKSRESVGQVGSPQTHMLQLKPCQLAEKENYDATSTDSKLREVHCPSTQVWSQYPIGTTALPGLPDPSEVILPDDLQSKSLLKERCGEEDKFEGKRKNRSGDGQTLSTIPELNDEQLLADALSAVSLAEGEHGGQQISAQAKKLNEAISKTFEPEESEKLREPSPPSPKKGLENASSHRLPSDGASRLPNAPAGCSALCVGLTSSPLVKNRRSKSVEPLLSQSTQRKRNTTNSKSCPPARSQLSPVKEVKKLLIKNDHESIKKKESSHLSGKVSPKKPSGRQQPLLRRPGQRESVASYFVKPVDTPIPDCANDLEGPETKGKDQSGVVDVDSWACAKENKERSEAIACIRDALKKWSPNINEHKLPAIEALALKFLLNINSTICYFVTALKLLSRAPWTERMVPIDVRQSALVAISNGWCLNSASDFCPPFSKSELSIAAALYEGAILPEIGEDVTHGLKVVIDKLPEACECFFTKANYVCPTCLASVTGQVHVFCTAITWQSDDWVNLRTELLRAEHPLGNIPKIEHAQDCIDSDTMCDIIDLGKWIYLEFRPQHPWSAAFYPRLLDVKNLLEDCSLQEDSLAVTGLVCSNVTDWPNAHYWYVDVKEGRLQTIYDSLSGNQPITTEVAKKLQVTGILITKNRSSKPRLTSALLNSASGMIATKTRKAQPIKVPTRQKVNSVLKFLKKSKEDTISSKRRPYPKVRSGSKAKKKDKSQPSKATNSTSKGRAPKDVKCRFDQKRNMKLDNAFAIDPIQRASASGQDGKLSPSDPIEEVSDGEIVRPNESHQGPCNQNLQAMQHEAPDVVSLSEKEKEKEITAKLVGAEVTSSKLRKRLKQSFPPERFLAGSHEPHEELKGKDLKSRKVVPLSSLHDRPHETRTLTPCAPAGCSALCADREIREGLINEKDPTSHKDEKSKSGELLADVTQGRYGIISLFDGVSSIVPIVTEKVGYPPVAVVLAENDIRIRSLVCDEFGYRPDEKWGYVGQGTAALYVKDVHALIANGCRVLQELVMMFPGCKWIIAGGSPCQDLTLAGVHRGLLGLVGRSSRLFFVLLCVIHTIQRLVGPAWVRFFVENAGSMQLIHLKAFCKLLGLPLKTPKDYLWDPTDFGYIITRCRNFFRNYRDVGNMQEPPGIFEGTFGPMVNNKGQIIPFAPLLRVRDPLPHGILRASWTLYQPHALVWDYSFWNGKHAFGQQAGCLSDKIPKLPWDRIVPPPFLSAWRYFLRLLEEKKGSCPDMDAAIGPLLPMFSCSNYKLPFRTLTESEVAILSGLHDHWKKTSVQDADKLPEDLIRSMCGNCFHPSLVQ